jgi:hypothetical protein
MTRGSPTIASRFALPTPSPPPLLLLAFVSTRGGGAHGGQSDVESVSQMKCEYKDKLPFAQGGESDILTCIPTYKQTHLKKKYKIQTKKHTHTTSLHTSNICLYTQQNTPHNSHHTTHNTYTHTHTHTHTPSLLRPTLAHEQVGELPYPAPVSCADPPGTVAPRWASLRQRAFSWHGGCSCSPPLWPCFVHCC